MKPCIPELTREITRRFSDLESITGGRGQRLIHIGNERAAFKARSTSDLMNTRGKTSRFVQRCHEGTVTDLYVHHQTVKTGRKFLGKNRRRNKRNGFHRGSHIAHAVDTPIRGRQRRRLTNNGTTHPRDHLLKTLNAWSDVIARDARKLIQRSACMAKAPPGNHGNKRTARGQHRCQHQTHTVANAARRVFIYDWPVKI